MTVSAVDALCMVISVVSASTATTWFALMGGHPVMKACWRLQLAALLQVPLMVVELRGLSAADFGRWKRALLRSHLPVGALMGAHFSAVSLCVANTSLSHAILVINTAPLFLVIAAMLRWGGAQAVAGVTHGGRRFQAMTGGGGPGEHDPPAPVPVPTDVPRTLLQRVLPPTCLPPTSVEVVGSFVAFLGVTGLVVSAGAAGGDADEARASWRGDMMGLFASASLSIYWVVTSTARKWCPLFAWLCPLNAAAAATCAAFSLLFIPGTTLYDASAPVGVFTWLAGGPLFYYALAAAILASSFGHGLAAFVIGRCGPLPVSVAMLLQPPTGTLIGFAAGVQGPPGAAAMLCAPVILAGAYLVTVGGREKGLTWTHVLGCNLRGEAGGAGKSPLPPSPPPPVGSGGGASPARVVGSSGGRAAPAAHGKAVDDW